MPAAARLVLGEKLDLNSVSQEDLLLIPGMRPNLAAAIVNRRGNEPWVALDDLQEVPGIGPGLVRKWKDHLEVR
jgi:DNA uptake protein ComE-like DNA-binding protein